VKLTPEAPRAVPSSPHMPSCIPVRQAAHPASRSESMQIWSSQVYPGVLVSGASPAYGRAHGRDHEGGSRPNALRQADPRGWLPSAPPIERSEWLPGESPPPVRDKDLNLHPNGRLRLRTDSRLHEGAVAELPTSTRRSYPGSCRFRLSGQTRGRSPPPACIR
jgi:hypothetical protein